LLQEVGKEDEREDSNVDFAENGLFFLERERDVAVDGFQDLNRPSSSPLWAEGEKDFRSDIALLVGDGLESKARVVFLNTMPEV
jgi:hypothetical protein